ncbi:hypothetical protein ACT009_05335 [Sphingomonas sp. Tas61C01]|uniref:hypothetical protein n=1 Tax=Sphingomonas sp. Tas61C01 TaxID=3458297 RepID=UPI00403E70A2
MKTIGWFITAGAAALSGQVAAQDAPATASGRGVVSAAVTAGTLGIGPDVGFRFSDHVGVRGSATFLGVSSDFDSDDITYRGKLKLKSFGAMVDVFPFGGAFRISGGARINRNRVNVSATPSADSTGTVTVGDEEFTAAQVGTLTGRATVKKFAPALTLGWAGKNRPGFFFMAEGGVLFQGAARLRDFRASGSASTSAQFNAALERERRDLQDDVDKVKVYPILQIGIGYRF